MMECSVEIPACTFQLPKTSAWPPDSNLLQIQSTTLPRDEPPFEEQGEEIFPGRKLPLWYCLFCLAVKRGK